MPEKICDGETRYTCEVEVTEEEGKVYLWFGTDREATLRAYQHDPPDSTLPIDRRTEKWADDCGCPEGCQRFVRDTQTLDRRGQRVAWRRMASDGMAVEEGTKAVRWSKVKVTFVCARLEEEQIRTHRMDPTDLEAYAVSDYPPGFTREAFGPIEHRKG